MQKHLIVFGAVLIATLGLAHPADAVVNTISPVMTDPVTGYKYQLLSQADWTDSEAAAVALGGQLPTIANQEQQNFVFNSFGAYGGTQRILWTGLYDPTQDSQGGHANNFVWVSGAPITYTDWDAGEPNNAGGEYWVAMYYPNFNTPGSWNDWSNRTADPVGIQFDGVVQFAPVPEPASALLAGPLLMLGLKRRSRASAR
jgi:hypothetical protein